MRPDRSENAFLLRIAELLHAYGTPAHRLERVLGKMADSLGVAASFLVTPTAVMASFGRGAEERTHLRRVEGGDVDLGKLIEFDQVMEDVEDGRLTADEAIARADEIDRAPPRYSSATVAFAFGVASAGAARFFGGGAAEVLLSFAIGPLLFALGRMIPRRPTNVGVYEPLAAFVAAATALLAGKYAFDVDDRIVTLSSLIVLIPGLTLTVALTELATRHLVSGVARLAGAAALFLMILLGVALAWRLAGFLPGDEHASSATPLPAWTEWVALLFAPFAFGVVLQARPAELPVIFATGVAGYVAARTGAEVLGTDLGPFFGALVVGVLSHVYARRCDHPALVPQTPGILLLVPGSLGYRSLTSFLERDALLGMEWAFQMGLVAISLVGGLLAANLVLPPRRVL